MGVVDNIPAFAKHGVFKESGIYSGVGRFSSSPGVPSPDDAAPAARGLALSLKGPGGEAQDFLMTNLDFFVKNMEEVMTVVRAKAAAAMVPQEQAAAKNFEVVAAALGPERAKFVLERLQRQLAKPVASLATESFFSDMPIRVGPYVAKFGVRPLDPEGHVRDVGENALRRQLVTEGFAFRSLVAEVRLVMAKKYLEAGRHSIGEIAFLLGFSEASAFHRAFRRWTGATPQQHMRSRAGHVWSARSSIKVDV